MNELERDIYCLNEIKKELSVSGRGDDYIKAIDDATINSNSDRV